MKPVKQPLALIILDGFGWREEKRGNAIAQANLPYFHQLLREWPWTTLEASGLAVGLPQGQMGNSEVGHLNMGAGRIVYQEFTRISLAIKEKTFFQNEVLKEAMQKAKNSGKAVHLLGLVSDGGVHSHIEHLYALLDLAKAEGVERVYIHAFLDGRDVPPANALEYIRPLEQKLSAIGLGKIATVSGRYYAMDRDKRWERVEKAYAAMVYGEGVTAASAEEAVQSAYNRGETDEFVKPAVIVTEGKPVATVKAGDTMIFFNFRPDRARQLTRAFVDQEFSGFERRQGYFPVYFVCMTEYDATIPAPVAFPPQSLKNTLGEVLAAHGKTQLRIAETEKYAHVTFFFNGGVEIPNPGEDRLLIPSPKVATYDQKPEMSAFEVTAELLKELEQDKYDVIILNYANPDMVGHTGDMEATIKAVEAVDQCLAKVVPAILKRGGVAIITGDHGNADCKRDDEGNVLTSHTTSPVPFVLVSPEHKEAKLRADGKLADVAPTILELMGLPQPEEMTGQTLLIK
ncbi:MULTISPECIES: 2,3-bisphosphoglycerate-independent phosphoglycerate mutase [unclassified Carboxydocella]|uniref:2,3-bisphosphoglycerate-independent phosphoglycerate mutase n=1 Tax=unclassified Carboxydocella TaxID=2685367 RepID=UPI0009AC5FBF|nr:MULTISPECIES: 2,3-bisphosphoglycerate-independent phosphoglycerate mutase [unclassified Carboxydocella]GAW29809.1 phosphoglycerate mutase (2,3-diphosphoglycerate-independent) [Carboxydocella sp. ULO1]GAW31382.1 phosphoglycerate mutase (2,3-diphosphoglycerate-independent) [Carboxydocella sp. JDF658]